MGGGARVWSTKYPPAAIAPTMYTMSTATARFASKTHAAIAAPAAADACATSCTTSHTLATLASGAPASGSSTARKQVGSTLCTGTSTTIFASAYASIE